MSIRVIASEHLIDANNDLQAQNERQRKQLASLNAAYGRIKSENDKLKAENAKLRELVRDFERYRFGNCQHCGYEEQCMARQTNCYKVHLDLLIRARELGLVVE